MPDPGSSLREIHWRETWPDEDHPNDLCGYDGEDRIGRIYADRLSITAGNRPVWKWFTSWGGHDNQGWVPSRREAMLVIEARYAAFLAAGGTLPRPRG